jgi:hypothetical protein
MMLQASRYEEGGQRARRCPREWSLELFRRGALLASPEREWKG